MIIWKRVMSIRVDMDSFIFVTFLMAMVVTVTNFNYTVMAQTEAREKLTAELSGQNEVPPTNSLATGFADFEIIGRDSIQYNLNATSIENVTAGHLHGGLEGQNGPILVQLFSYDAPVNQVSETGTITENNPAFLSGTVTSQQQLHDFMTAMRKGQIYVNIHTEQNPDGEIRGQITTNDGS